MVNIDEMQQRFEAAFPGVRPIHLARAPGRVNLIGEHTDYNDGFVFPIAMSQSLYVAAGPADDGHLTIRSTARDCAETIRVPLAQPVHAELPKWGSYVCGVADLLRKGGIQLKAGKLLIHSELPLGGGVSSSAALEVASAKAMLALAGQSMEAVPLAHLARQAEHHYAGTKCGIMDQFIVVLGQADRALLLDCRSQSYEQVPFVLKDEVLLVMDTRVKHKLAEVNSQYGMRQMECQEAVKRLQALIPGIRALRDVSPMMLNAHRTSLPSTPFYRARHVTTENERTCRAADALRMGDLDTFGRLMFESHRSLDEDYGVTCPELNDLVRIAAGVAGVYGARMTGGGFGGCVIALVRKSAEAALKAAVAERYDTRFEKPALIYPTTASDGASLLAIA